MNLSISGSVLLGLRLRQARKQRKFSQQQVASMAELDAATVRNLENGRGGVRSLLAVLKVLEYRFSFQSEEDDLPVSIRRNRVLRRHSQQRLAELAGLSKPSIIQLERGLGRINSLSAVLEALHVSMELIPAGSTSGLFPATARIEIHQGDCLSALRNFPPESFCICVTSPPYFRQRDYGVADQIGFETSSKEYIDRLVKVFREVKRVLKKDGTLWLNLGDTMTRSGVADRVKPKNLLGIPWRIAFALQEDGWNLRQDIIIHKRNPMPEPVTDRCVRAHDYMFLMSKSAKYCFDASAIRERGTTTNPGRPQKDTRLTHGSQSGGNTGLNAAKQRMREELSANGFVTRNKHSVWSVGMGASRTKHYATFSEELVEPCILAGCPVGGTVLDPFGGSGTTARVAHRLNRNATIIDINPRYVTMMQRQFGLLASDD